MESVSLSDGDTLYHAWEKYDAYGQIVEKLILRYGHSPDERTTLDYEGKNIQLKKIMERDGGEWKLLGQTEYVYDAQGKLIRENIVRQGSKGRIEYVYAGELMQKELHYSADSLEFTYTHFYDRKGNQIRTESLPHTVAPVYIKRITRKFDGKGRLIRTTTYSSEGSSSEIRYTYGLFSGRLKKKIYDNGSNQRQVVRFRSFKGMDLVWEFRENGRLLTRSRRSGDQVIREELDENGRVTQTTYIFCAQ